jgi:hypothetical protein
MGAASKRKAASAVDEQRVFSVSTTLAATIRQNGEYLALTEDEQRAVRAALCALLTD